MNAPITAPAPTPDDGRIADLALELWREGGGYGWGRDAISLAYQRCDEADVDAVVAAIHALSDAAEGDPDYGGCW